MFLKCWLKSRVAPQRTRASGEFSASVSIALPWSATAGRLARILRSAQAAVHCTILLEWPRIRGQYLPDLFKDRLGSQIPELVKLIEKARQIACGQVLGRRRKCVIPAFLGRGALVRPRIKLGKRHHCKLRGTERRVKALINWIAFPIPFRAL